jgi:hypothetical protein
MDIGIPISSKNILTMPMRFTFSGIPPSADLSRSKSFSRRVVLSKLGQLLLINDSAKVDFSRMSL